MTPCEDSFATVGRIRTASTQATETRMKSAVIARQDLSAEDQQPGLSTSLLKNNIQCQPSQEQHGGGGCNGAGAAPG